MQCVVDLTMQQAGEPFAAAHRECLGGEVL